MADIPNWQSILTAAATAVASAWGGAWWGRTRERVKWEEQSQAELRKARIDAILEIAHALGRHHRASVKALIMLQEAGPEEPSGDPGERLLEALRARSETTRELLDTAFANLFLIPPELRSVLQDELAVLTNPETPEASRDAVSRMAVAVEEYLPPMRKLQRFVLRRSAGAPRATAPDRQRG